MNTSVKCFVIVSIKWHLKSILQYISTAFLLYWAIMKTLTAKCNPHTTPIQTRATAMILSLLSYTVNKNSFIFITKAGSIAGLLHKIAVGFTDLMLLVWLPVWRQLPLRRYVLHNDSFWNIACTSCCGHNCLYITCAFKKLAIISQRHNGLVN